MFIKQFGDKYLVRLEKGEDKECGSLIEKSVGNNVLNTCGSYNINQSASLVKQAKKVITHDTGLMHIAAAFNKKIISVWGNTIPEFGMYSIDEQNNRHHVIEVSNLNCRPCSKLGHNTCPQRHFACMNNIPANDVAALVN